LVAFPTETVYGLGVHALDRSAVRRLFDAKGRPSTDPLIVHVASVADVAALTGALSDTARRLAERFWPGPLTLVLPKTDAVPDEVTAGLSSVALRVPSHPVALALLRAARIPVAAPSANLFSRPSPTRAAHVLADLAGAIDMVLDGGATAIGVESTVVDLTSDIPRVLRPGGTPIEALADALGFVPSIGSASAQGPLPSPGLLARHYSPRTPLTAYEGEAAQVVARIRCDALVETSAGRRVGLLLLDEDAALQSLGVARLLGPASRLDVVATNVYAALRELDEAGVDVILAHGFTDERGFGAALRDRVRRAAAGRVISC
jgi:L-threonylcarbamoyladenylate synthase